MNSLISIVVLFGILVPLCVEGSFKRQYLMKAWYWREHFENEPAAALNNYCTKVEFDGAQPNRCRVNVYFRMNRQWTNACEYSTDFRQRNQRYWRIELECREGGLSHLGFGQELYWEFRR